MEKIDGSEIIDEITEEAPHDYFAMLPKVVEYLGLSPYAYRLYCHFKQITGERGKCTRSTLTLAEECLMSAGSVSNAKRELTSTTPPLIRITNIAQPGGIGHRITITDIWGVNHAFFNGECVHMVNAKGECVQDMNALRSPGETNKILKIKETTTTAPDTTEEVHQIVGEVFRRYENEIGPLTPLIRDEINVFLNDPKCPIQYILDAMDEAARNNKRNWAYAKAILRRWIAEGKTPRNAPRRPIRGTEPKRPIDPEEQARLVKKAREEMTCQPS